MVAPCEAVIFFVRDGQDLPVRPDLSRDARIFVRKSDYGIIPNSALPSLLPITLPASRPRSSSLLSLDTLLGCFPYFTVPGLAQTPMREVRPQSVSGGWIWGRDRGRERVHRFAGARGSYRRGGD